MITVIPKRKALGTGGVPVIPPAVPQAVSTLLEDAAYGKVLKTAIQAGLIKLSSTVKDGEWYDKSGVEIDADHGINIYGKDNALTTRATKDGAIQCYVGADGKIKAGGGAVILDAEAIKVDHDLPGAQGYQSWYTIAGAARKGELAWYTADRYGLQSLDYPIILSSPSQGIECNLDFGKSLYSRDDQSGDLGRGDKIWRYLFVEGHRNSATISAGGEWWWATRGTATPLLWGGNLNYQYYKDYQIKLDDTATKILNKGTAGQSVAAFRLAG